MAAFGKRSLKPQKFLVDKFRVDKFRVDCPLETVRILARATFKQWSASWQAFEVATLMLDICALAFLLAYEQTVEQWQAAWALIREAGDDQKGVYHRQEDGKDRSLGLHGGGPFAISVQGSGSWLWMGTSGLSKFNSCTQQSVGRRREV